MRREQPRSTGRQSLWAVTPKSLGRRGSLLPGANDEEHLTAPNRIHRIVWGHLVVCQPSSGEADRHRSGRGRPRGRPRHRPLAGGRRRRWAGEERRRRVREGVAVPVRGAGSARVAVRPGCRLLGGGPAAFKARLASLRGHPVVVNQWASWCGPCRAEFPHFQRLSLSLGKRVAFLGVDAMDNDGDAAAFLKRSPIAYPSYKDGDGKVAQVFNGVGPLPKTIFYSRSGKLQYVHVGQYRDEAALRRDISRYAGA